MRLRAAASSSARSSFGEELSAGRGAHSQVCRCAWRSFAQRVVHGCRTARAIATEPPRELEGLEARLKDGLKHGDPDMPADELQAAIDRA